GQRGADHLVVGSQALLYQVAASEPGSPCNQRPYHHMGSFAILARVPTPLTLFPVCSPFDRRNATTSGHFPVKSQRGRELDVRCLTDFGVRKVIQVVPLSV